MYLLYRVHEVIWMINDLVVLKYIIFVVTYLLTKLIAFNVNIVYIDM